MISVRPATDSKFVTLRQIGFRSVKHSVALTSIAGTIGFILFLIQGPASLNPVSIANVFSQTLPGSIAEVVVCWAVVDAFAESVSKNRLGKIPSMVLAIFVSTFLFGLYHFAHSSPFNEIDTVFFLMLPGLLTSVVYFVGRNIYAAIIFHNFQALFGVMASAQITQLLQLQYPVLMIAAASVLALVISDKVIMRKKDPIQNH